MGGIQHIHRRGASRQKLLDLGNRTSALILASAAMTIDMVPIRSHIHTIHTVHRLAPHSPEDRVSLTHLIDILCGRGVPGEED
jgi:hypothetical protein